MKFSIYVLINFSYFHRDIFIIPYENIVATWKEEEKLNIERDLSYGTFENVELNGEWNLLRKYVEGVAKFIVEDLLSV